MDSITIDQGSTDSFLSSRTMYVYCIEEEVDTYPCGFMTVRVRYMHLSTLDKLGERRIVMFLESLTEQLQKLCSPVLVHVTNSCDFEVRYVYSIKPGTY